MAYTNFQHCTKQEYEQTIYSNDARNEVKIWFNNIELEDADLYCEKITRVWRILPNNGSKRFSLDNFISQEIDLVLHKIDVSSIQDQVTISIGTLVNGSVYEYVPLGVFNIQGTPKTDKDKVTIKLRDNRVKFDFAYDAKPLIDAYGGTATKRQILNDICTKAGVTNGVISFLGENDAVSIYDNMITATNYVSYIADQAGRIPVINRDGALIFIDILNLATQRIPLSIVEKYELGEKYKIQRVVFEDGAVKFQTSQDTSLDTLYLNSANPYITSQEQVENIFDLVENFEIDSLKTGKILGNPAIDPYDLIEIYDDYDQEEPVIAKTLANHTFTYRGVMTSEYDTQIGIEERKENVTVVGEANFRKYAKAEYDNVEGRISLMAGEVDEQNTKIAEIQVTVDEINSKISDVIDITTTAEDTDAQVELENINESEPIQIKIHPIGESISYLYPNSNLFPSPTTYLKIRKLMFIRTYIEDGVTKTQEIPYILPDDLLYYDSEHFDEFYLDYDSRTCQVTKRCEYNADGTVGLLANENIVSYPYPTITLGSGDYTVKLVGYTSGYLFVRMMVQNIYTTQFYTKAETNSLIEQTSESINLEVSRKVGNDEVISKINQSAEAITIDANKLNLQAGDIINIIAGNTLNLTSKSIAISSTNFSVTSSGNITAKGGTIGGWNISANALFTANNNYYLGTTGITATIGGTSRSNIIFKAGSNFGVNSSGTLYAKNAVLNDATVSGTINATAGSISGSLVTSGINADNISAGTITGAGIFIYNGIGFLKMIWDSNHPYVSALNVGLGSGGISFRNSGSRYDLGGEVGHVYGSSAGYVVIEGNTGTLIQDINIQTDYIMGCYQLSGISDTYIRLNYSVVLKPNPYGGAYIWGTEDYNKILTVGGSPSTLSIKENVKEKETSDIPDILTKIKLYDYNYIKEINDGKEDYGYIIDYLEKIDGIDKYFVFNEVERNGLKYKTINHEHLSKFLLGAVIELQKEVNLLKEELVNG